MCSALLVDDPPYPLVAEVVGTAAGVEVRAAQPLDSPVHRQAFRTQRSEARFESGIAESEVERVRDACVGERSVQFLGGGRTRERAAGRAGEGGVGTFIEKTGSVSGSA